MRRRPLARAAPAPPRASRPLPGRLAVGLQSSPVGAPARTLLRTPWRGNGRAPRCAGSARGWARNSRTPWTGSAPPATRASATASSPRPRCSTAARCGRCRRKVRPWPPFRRQPASPSGVPHGGHPDLAPARGAWGLLSPRPAGSPGPPGTLPAHSPLWHPTRNFLGPFCFFFFFYCNTVLLLVLFHILIYHKHISILMVFYHIFYCGRGKPTALNLPS